MKDELIKSKGILVDEQDYYLLKDHLVIVYPSNTGYTNYVLLRKRITKEYIGTLHGVILSNNTCVDHINGNGLDCRRNNLRIATHSQNAQNRRTQPSKSGIKGVNWVKNYNKWRAGIKLNGTFIFLGYFEDINEAARVRQEAELKYFPVYLGDGTDNVEY